MNLKQRNFRNYIFIPLILGLTLLASCGKSPDPNSNANSTTSPGNGKQTKDGYVGKIIKTPAGSQYDDYFQTQTGEYGIESFIEIIQTKLIELRDTGQEVILWGELLTDIPDYGGHQILVNKIKVPAEEFKLAWYVEKNEELGVSFHYPEHTTFEVRDNSINFDGWALEFFKNPKSIQFQEWLDSNFAESSSTPCQLNTTTGGLTIGGYETYKVSIGEEGTQEELGIFGISNDKQNIVQLLLTEFPNQNYKKIIQTLRFTKTLTKDEVDINEAKKNGENNEQAGLANPASVYCEEQGGKVELRTDKKTKGQYGVCIFKDETECEEWAFYRGECQPDDNK